MQVFAPAGQSFALLLGLEEGFAESHGSEGTWCGCGQISSPHFLRASSAPHPASRVSHIGRGVPPGLAFFKHSFLSAASSLCHTAAPVSFLIDTELKGVPVS